MNNKYVDFNALLHHTFERVVNKNDDSIVFYVNDNHYFELSHSQDCCESVYVESVSGELDSLVGFPILYAEESTQDNDDEGDGCGMWTFYKLATVKGWVDIRFYGSSNGYYGVGVDVMEYKNN